MILKKRLHCAALPLALATVVMATANPHVAAGQEKGVAAFELPAAEPSSIALPLALDRGQAAVEQALKRLHTTASVMMIVAHPDDEDGALLTYLSRGMGARAILFTLTRGEGGQNAMSADSYDALGLIRTNELLKASEYYGAKQMWGTEADFGFSKTQEESFAKWGHDRVLYDAVLAVRRERPQVIVSTFVGGITDGHGQHQVSGEIAQEVFKAAGDAKVFPEQLKDGLQPWQPLAVYSMTPFAPVTEKGMFDYATGKWAPAKFHNYVTGEWTNGVPSTDVTLQVGDLDTTLGQSYAQISREGWGEQKSQNGGANPTLSGPDDTSYHLWAVATAAKAGAGTKGDSDLFHNNKVEIDTSIAGIARLAPGAPAWLGQGLAQIEKGVGQIGVECSGSADVAFAHKLAPLYKETLELRARIAASTVDAQAKAGVLGELDAKIAEFEDALKGLLGLDMVAFRTNQAAAQNGGFRGNSADETPRSVAPGEELKVHVHAAHSADAVQLEKVWLKSSDGEDWKCELASGATSGKDAVADPIFRVRVPENAEATKPFFTRPTLQQPYYDVSNEAWRERSFAPWPLAAWAEWEFDGVPLRVGTVVQTLGRVTGPGGIYQPLVVTPAIGVRVSPESRLLPLDGSSLPVDVTVHTEGAAEGTVELKLPAGWKAEPTQAELHRKTAGDAEPIHFSVTPSAVEAGAYPIEAVVHAGGRSYESGWESVGYAGLRPYNQYRTAVLKTRKVDVKLAPGLKIAYVMGPGDLVPDAMESLGVAPHLLTDEELASADLSTWNVVVIGIRAYTVRPALAHAQGRLDEFVRQGGTLIVQYQTSDFPAPLPLSLGGRMAERVVDEQAPVKLLKQDDALLTWPNRITPADFDGWAEERGHSFLDSWDKGYDALTETADPGQNPQRGGLLVTHPGKGTYIYVAYALYRQFPDLVPGAYRIFANLLSAGRHE
ncbi:MAG TPA: PIG-L family deacetylase [Terracidiphilus sp.]|jgi:LmbE family N-acetylglucosaminyl deacetylase|nr:PIG-L family deacetylase [Terracidiphilus sp.]